MTFYIIIIEYVHRIPAGLARFFSSVLFLVFSVSTSLLRSTAHHSTHKPVVPGSRPSPSGTQRPTRLDARLTAGQLPAAVAAAAPPLAAIALLG